MPLRVNGFYSRSKPNVVWDPESQHYVLALTEEEEIAQSRKVTWTFIFVDLIFLALVTKCASVLTACSLSVHTIMFCSIVITIMFVTRLHMDDYCNRFYENDIFHRILLFLYALCMFVMTLNVNAINTNGDPSDAGCEADLYGVAFGGSFIGCRLIMVILYLSVIFSDSKLQALRQFGGAAVSLGVSAFIVFVCVMVEVKTPAKLPPGKKFNVYIACMCVEIAWNTWQNWSLAFGSFLKKVNCPCHKVLAGKEVFPLQIDSYQDRIGSFVMIIFGEVLVKNLCRYYDVSYAEQTYGYSIASLVIVFMFGILYYEAAKEDEDRHHALRHSIISSYLYIWMHLLVACSAFFTNAAIGVLFEDDYPTISRVEVEEVHPSDDAALILSKSHKAIFSPNGLLACSMGLTLLFLAIISLLHKGLGQLMDWQNGGGARRTIILKLFLAFIHFIIPATGLTKGHKLVATHAVLLSLAVAAELRFKKSEEEEEEGIDSRTGKRKKGKNSKKKKRERDDYHDGDGDEESKSVHSYDDDDWEDDAIPHGEGDFHRRMRMRDDFDYDDRSQDTNQMDHDHGGGDDRRRGRDRDNHHGDDDDNHDNDHDHHDEYEEDYEDDGRGGQQLVPLGQEHMYPPPAPSSPSRRERGKSREEDRDLDRERDRGSTRDDYHDDYLDGEAEGYYSDDVENPHNHTRERRDKRGDKHDVHERKEARKSTALEGSGGLVNLDRRGANRRQSLRMQAEAASPKDAHMMTVAAPKSNPLAGSGRRGSLLGKATANVGAGAGSYQAGVDRRRSRISDLATSAQRVSQRATPSPSAKSPMH